MNDSFFKWSEKKDSPIWFIYSSYSKLLLFYIIFDRSHFHLTYEYTVKRNFLQKVVTYLYVRNKSQVSWFAVQNKSGFDKAACFFYLQSFLNVL